MSTDSGRCPTCDSHSPELHPAVQHEGEVQPCSDPFHDDTSIPVGRWRHPDGTMRRIPNWARAGILTDNEVLALHLRTEHGARTGWTAEPVPAGRDFSKLLNRMHVDDCRAHPDTPCSWTRGTA